jgi:hypothetical protein
MELTSRESLRPCGVARRDLKTLFCEQFNCPVAAYEERAFKRCLYWHARLVVPAVRVLSPSFFAEDLKFMQELGLTSGWRAARSEVLTFQDANRATGGFWRNSLRLRVSGRKAADLSQRLFAEERRKRTRPETNEFPS